MISAAARRGPLIGCIAACAIMDQDCCMLVRYKDTNDDFVSAVGQERETG